MHHSLSDLRAKEAINITDGRYLGSIIDAVVDLEQGLVSGILLPGGFLSNHIFIPYKAIVLIGVDVVLINLALAKEAD